MDGVQREHIDKFMNAALRNNLEVLEDMIAHEFCGPGVNFTDKLGRTALHCLLSGATFKNLDDLKRGLRLLKGKGAAVNMKDYLSNTPLHLIFETYDVKIPTVVELVLEIFSDYDWTIKDADGYTVFHMFLSTVNQHLEEADKLHDVLQSRYDFIKLFLNGNVQGTDAKLITVLLNTKNKCGISAFQTYIDSEYFDFDIVELMIKKGADVNTCSNLGITPLMCTALRRGDEVMKLLLQGGADPNARDMFGQTALFRICTEMSLQYLCEYGADLYVHDRDEKSPLTNYGFYIPQDLPQTSPILDKNKSQYRPLAKLLLQCGLNPNSTDIYGSSLLHYAAFWGDVQITKLLIEFNATPDVTDCQGMTPYSLAAYRGNFDVLHLLETENSQSIDPQCNQTYERVERYARMALRGIKKTDSDNVLDISEARDEPDALINHLLAFPKCGMVSRKPEAVDLVQSVSEVMQKAASAMSSLDKRFRASVKPIGSSAEGTVAGDPAELDFVFCLDYFSEECEAIQSESLLGTGFCKLALKQNTDDNHPLKCFEKRKGFICAIDVRKLFQDLLCQALNQREVWQDIHVYFDGVFDFPVDKPILRLQIIWNGPFYKRMSVTVDIVPAMHKTNWFPKEMNEGNLNILSDRVKKAGFFMLFHGPELSNDEFDDYVRISSAAMETEFFKTSPVIFHEIFVICKILKGQAFTKMAQFNEAMNIDEHFSGEDDKIEEEEKERETGDENETEEIDEDLDSRQIWQFIEHMKKYYESVANSELAENSEFQSLDKEFDVEDGEFIEACDYITSYMLKNCLLHVLHKKKMQTGIEDLSHWSIVREIFTYLLRCTVERRLNAYCMPFVDIFSYVNEFIRQVEPGIKETELQLLCDKIGYFCRIILENWLIN